MKKVGVAAEILSMSSSFFSKNAFEKFNLPFALNINIEDLEEQYFKAQHQYHPDRLKASGKAQEEATALYAAAFNEAYQILKDPLKRADHLLKCLGWLFSSDENLGADQDPQLLTLMMDFNEKIEEAVTEDAKKNLDDFLQQEIHHAWNNLESSLDKHDKNNAVRSFMKLKYLQRLKQNLK